MAEMEFFPGRPESHPTIYAYEFIGVASHQGYIKVGYTERDVETRIKEQTHIAAVPYRILGRWSAMKNDGSCFTDHAVHAVLKAKGKQQLNAGEDRNEWFRCTLLWPYRPVRQTLRSAHRPLPCVRSRNTP